MDGRTDGRTDMTKLIVAFRNYADSPKTTQLMLYREIIAVSLRPTQNTLRRGLYLDKHAKLGRERLVG